VVHQNGRIDTLEGDLEHLVVTPWATWEQETDDPEGPYRDRHSGARRTWAEVAAMMAGPWRGTVTRVFRGADGGLRSEMTFSTGRVMTYRDADVRGE
jgi:hypothetical protein